MNQHETKQTGAALRLFVYMILIAALLLPAPATTAQACRPVQQVGAAAAPDDLHRHIHQLHRARFDYRGHGQGQRQPRY